MYAYTHTRVRYCEPRPGARPALAIGGQPSVGGRGLPGQDLSGPSPFGAQEFLGPGPEALRSSKNSFGVRRRRYMCSKQV